MQITHTAAERALYLGQAHEAPDYQGPEPWCWSFFAKKTRGIRGIRVMRWGSFPVRGHFAVSWFWRLSFWTPTYQHVINDPAGECFCIGAFTKALLSFPGRKTENEALEMKKSVGPNTSKQNLPTVPPNRTHRWITRAFGVAAQVGGNEEIQNANEECGRISDQKERRLVRARRGTKPTQGIHRQKNIIIFSALKNLINIQ